MLSTWRIWLDKQRKKCNIFRWNSCVQPKKAASAEFSFTEHANWTPGMRHQSLPSRLFGNFRSERNVNEEMEQLFLKQFLKEHGLYNKHQTIEQRRRLKYLLEWEQRTTLLLPEERVNDLSFVQSDTGQQTCLIELHSMPFAVPVVAPKILSSSAVSSPKPRRNPPLSEFAFAKTIGNRKFKRTAISLPSIEQAVEDEDTAKPEDLKTFSWFTSTTSATNSFLETAV